MKLNLVQSQPQVTETLNQAVLTYKELKAKITFLENELKSSKEIIEAALSQTQEGSIITENWKASLSISQRESFSLKNAKAILGEEALKPFISNSVYTSLRVS